MDGVRAPNQMASMGHGGPQTQSRPHGHDLRIPTVDEALPYTPFSSIVPFNPNIITPPLALPNTTPTAFEKSEEIHAARRELERLSAGAQNAEAASKRCQQTLSDVRRLLEGDGLMQFKFKKTKRTLSNNASAVAKEPALSNFAKMVYDTTSVQYRYLTPESQEGHDDEDTIQVSPRKVKIAQPQQAPPVKAAAKTQTPAKAQRAESQMSEPHRTAYVQIPRMVSTPQNGQQSTPLQNLSQQQAQPNSSQGSQKLYVQPIALTPAQAAEYKRVPEPDSAPSRNQNVYLTNRAISPTQRAKSDSAVENLQTVLQEIFTAEDQMEPDTSGNVSKHAAKFFKTSDAGDTFIPVLRFNVQAELDVALKKVVSPGRLGDVEVESLARLQRLCEASYAAARVDGLQIGDDWSEGDVGEWTTRIKDAQAGLIGACSMIRILTGAAHHKELQSEDYVTGVIDAIRNVVERGIITVVEERSTVGEKIRGEKSVPRNPKFDIASENQETLRPLLNTSRMALSLLGNLLLNTDVDESAISSIEYLCKSLIFAENGSVERDSALGIQPFEKVRVTAMDVLARIFTKHTSMREGIVNGILFSLEKLPASKQSARQFRPTDGKPIQLVSALLMRLIQTSATLNSSDLRAKNDESDESDQVGDSEDEDSEEDESDASDENIKVGRRKKKSRSSKSQKIGGTDLRSVYTPLKDSAHGHANYIIRMLLSRALTSTKSGDEPFRKLLDIFVDDFLSVLGSSDWPASEILLRNLVGKLMNLANNPKSHAPHRTLSLELLGTIGSGILDLQSIIINPTKTLDGDDSISNDLVDLTKDFQSDGLSNHSITVFNGPYRVVLEYIHARGVEHDPQLQTARGYHLMQWADLVCDTREGSERDDVIVTPSFKRDLEPKLRHMIEDPQWLDDNSNFPAPSTSQGKLAAKIVAAGSKLCRAFNNIFNTVLQSMSSEQPTVRSRSLKSVTTLLEKDPSVLDRNSQILSQIMRCMADPSPLVRDSALGLVQKCVALRPNLDLKVYERVISRTGDQAVPVRKRSMAFLKQVYLRRDDNKIRAKISNALIARIKDNDESVAETALSTIEEVWFSAFAKLVKTEHDRSVDASMQLRAHAALIIQTVDLGDNVANVLEDLIKTLLVKSKQAADNVRVCKSFVAVLNEGIINTGEILGQPDKSEVLRALTVFAKAAPKLFTVGQIEHLEVYTQNLINSDDLEVFRSVINILRYTMPVLTGLGKEFLLNLQSALLKSAGKISKTELAVVAPCLWTIDTVLGGTERPLRLILSALTNLSGFSKADLTKDPGSANKVIKLLPIVGQLGKACDFTEHLNVFKSSKSFDWYKGTSVPGLLVEVICKFTSPSQPQPVRAAALEAVCEICQSYPEHFLRADVSNAIEMVFKERNQELEGVLLTSLESFFASDDTPSDEQEILGVGVESGTQRLGDTYKATGQDTAMASLSQRFLGQFLRIALSSTEGVALAAARIVVHINTRGMSHPGNSAPGLVALETCPTSAIAKLAFMAHREQFGKYENVFEKTLLKAVQQAFDYQHSIVRSDVGCTGHPPVSKLHFFWEVLKGGKPKIRTKLFTMMCASMDFDLAKLNLSGSPPQHLLYVRFCVENLAFFESDRADELLHLVSCMEKTFHGTGSSLAQAIESELLKLDVPVHLASEPAASDPDEIAIANASAMMMAHVMPEVRSIDSKRLQQLSVAAQILSLMWETRSFLHRYWNLQKHAGKPKNTAKEAIKAPTKATNAPTLIESYQKRIGSIMNADTTEEGQRNTCISFVDLFSVDHEVKVPDGEEEDIAMEDGEDSRSEGSSAKSPGPTPRGKKRKSLDAGFSASKKPAKKRKPSSAKVMGDDDEDGDWN
ncbi:sister chromatid cohesion mis4 [Lecanosticta acicola]|uniref:Sister chromatid cohesion protein n=1 Tax=Lecanosticta acicola TaxID=111012 RepID=A0AAI8Z0V7_9PEZI|nr:sister chromatid cohesion mis4 [Lecanosticta acicola]